MFASRIPGGPCAIGFNSFKRSANEIALSPDELYDCNIFSRNSGKNRGQGLHPSVFIAP